MGCNVCDKPMQQGRKCTADHLANVRAKNPDQWQFYKELTILNPASPSSMSHDISLYSTLRLPLADPEFMGEWRKYCSIAGVAIANHCDLVSFWDKRSGVLAKAAQFLVNLPRTPAEVERPFSLAGYADNKYHHSLPNDTRLLTNMLLFDRDMDGRFATP